MKSSKFSYIMGTATIILIVGGTIYAIKKSKEKEELEEDGVIDLEEARRMVKERQVKTPWDEHDEIDDSQETLEDPFEYDEELDTLMDDARDEASWNASFTQPTELVKPVNPVVEEVKYNAHEDAYENDKHDNKDTQNTKEDSALKHHPDSDEARNQFIHMELAEWAPSNPTYHIMERLFDFPFYPDNEGDYNLKSILIDNRMEFFGDDSIWNDEISYADIIMHYGRALSYNCGETVKYWVDYLVSNMDISNITTSAKLDERIAELNNHGYINDNTGMFGLFGLSERAFENALQVAGNTVEQLLTYDIEFNEFMKETLN